MTVALATEMKDYPGGAKAFAESLRPGIEALRPMRWPAERLDTLGGYITYHNLTLVALFLALYAAVQGAGAVRGGEERHSLEEVLASGWSRGAVVRDRAAGFLLVLLGISIGLALGVGLALAAAGEPNWGGSFIALLTGGLAAMVGYALGLLVSQLTGRARTASGISAAVLVTLYVLTNVWDQLGPFAFVRFVSPFHWANASRALVPGHGFDGPATLALVVLAGALVALAAWAFERRDYGGVLWPRRARVEAPGPVTVQRPMLRWLWTGALLRGRAGLLWWGLSGAAFAALVVLLEPTVMDAWDAFKAYMGGAAGPGATPEAQYLAFAGEVIMPFVAAYVLTQASGWVADLAQGRVEAVLAAPVSWTRLVLERILAVAAGVAVLTAGTLTGLVVTALVIDLPVDAAGLARVAVDCMLLGVALAGVAALVVAGLRSGLAVIALAVFVGVSYLVSLFAPMFDWPEWLARFSFFTAFGHPYLEWPAWGGILVLGGLALIGGTSAVVVAERTPKVA